ncbi:endonuclease V [uncultured Ruminococcus sp.]|uniref:endonuclease V n=1 Tax=uncultured Ruminococcus sp. TaxID=165186 RepID=UPI0025D1FDF8|nr:endonuclease V [uncultured Ruminococcus sp.]
MSEEINTEDMEQMQEKFRAVQEELGGKISCTDSFDINSIKTVAGIDLAYWKDENDKEQAVCCIVVIDYKTHEVIEKKHFGGKIDVPYMPGFLAFRELPLILETVKLLENIPDIYVFDGNGYLHPRHMGIASHASFYLERPTFGIAKTYFRADKKTDYTEPSPESGSFTDIVIGGEVYGRALRTHTGVRPVFVSVGNNISLDTACNIALELTDKESHIPIPTRLADLETHVMREKLRSQN